MGTVVINRINDLPVFFTGVLVLLFGSHRIFRCGIAGMFVMAVVMKVMFPVDVPATLNEVKRSRMLAARKHI